MKSEKAKEILNVFSYQPEGLNPFSVSVGSAVDAVEIAEQEMRDTAMEAHRIYCPYRAGGNSCFNNGEDSYRKSCDMKCYYMIHFKEYMK